MKKSFLHSLVIILSILFISINQIYADDTNQHINLDSVMVITDYNNFYQSEDFYFGGQPSIEALHWLKTEGVTTIINLRTDKEMSKYESFAYNEKAMVEELGMKYILVPVDPKSSYNTETLSLFARAIDENPGKICIHCGGCGRVTYLFMAYLIEYRKYSLDEVIEFGKKLKYNNPLEDLLEKEISMHLR